MRLRTTILIAGLALAAGPLFAAEVDLSKLPPASTKTGLTYTKDIRPMLEATCFRCHGEGDRPRAGLRLDSLASVLKGSDNGKVVEPGNSTKSLLLIAASGIDEEKAMPPRRGGRGGGMMVAPTNLATHIFTQADKDKDQKLTREELTAFANVLFEQMDTNRLGSIDQKNLVAGLTAVLAQAAPAGGGGFGGAGGFAGGRGPATPGAPAGGNAPGAQAAAGRAGQPGARPGGAPVAPGAQAGANQGRGGPAGPGGAVVSMPLTAEQVGLIRAWIDQGAK